jgi:hypothetical protein
VRLNLKNVRRREAQTNTPPLTMRDGMNHPHRTIAE